MLNGETPLILNFYSVAIILVLTSKPTKYLLNANWEFP
ncbi:hypothetical protein KP78_13430 [Jeotgalibacillus soli]|uniref:Uncharacterized protein n=1 Tax=Jeotgalibacillus soli TaxID=889306 RepID=A0A0C2RI85_9BACL|nr:hypothetical protein KP78_13430 [Jeotgalibacillus soli]